MKTKEQLERIIIWPWDGAPKQLKNLSDNGGDEDWIAVIPPSLKNRYIGFLEEGTPFGCCGVSIYEHPTLPGYEVRIGCHA